MAATPNRIVDSRHPGVLSGMGDWTLWRATYRGGEEFRAAHLKQFTNREDTADFKARRDITPIPTFAKAAIADIRNSIFQRMRDILRRGGSEAYQRAVSGLDLGVDRRGSTMNAFFGMKLLTELLVMGRVGVYVDAPVVPDKPTIVDAYIRRATYEIAHSLLDNKDPELELETLTVTSMGYGSVRTSYERNQVPIEHIVNLIPSALAFKLLRPFLRDDDAVKLSRVS